MHGGSYLVQDHRARDHFKAAAVRTPMATIERKKVKRTRGETTTTTMVNLKRIPDHPREARRRIPRLPQSLDQSSGERSSKKLSLLPSLLELPHLQHPC
jgi:hypothetical protein